MASVIPVIWCSIDARKSLKFAVKSVVIYSQYNGLQLVDLFFMLWMSCLWTSNLVVSHGTFEKVMPRSTVQINSIYNHQSFILINVIYFVNLASQSSEDELRLFIYLLVKLPTNDS